MESKLFVSQGDTPSIKKNNIYSSSMDMTVEVTSINSPNTYKNVTLSRNTSVNQQNFPQTVGSL